MDVTEYILGKTSRLTRQAEEVKVPPDYEMFNTGGVEVEVAEFLYSFVRLIKPSIVIETGTHLGVSSTYMARACQVNNKGQIITFEVISSLQQEAMALWNDVGVTPYISSNLQPSLNAELFGVQADMLFLDSEPQYRFAEFEKFWPNLKVGGFVVIHDLHPSLGHHGETYHGTYDWPYGYWRESFIRQVAEEFNIQTLQIQSPRGMTIFQKVDSSWEMPKFLNEHYRS
jgi:predicted O-methyltransferase YrrM